MTDEERENFRRMVRADMNVSASAVNGAFKTEFDQLLALSREDIDAIVPGTSDLETYDKLIAVVRRASASNVDAAELRAQILELGNTAVTIASKVGGLAKFFL